MGRTEQNRAYLQWEQNMVRHVLRPTARLAKGYPPGHSFMVNVVNVIINNHLIRLRLRLAERHDCSRSHPIHRQYVIRTLANRLFLTKYRPK